MTDAEMALELHAHRRMLEKAQRAKRHADIESGRITATDEAAFDKAMELMDQDVDIDDIIKQASMAAQAAAKAAGIDHTEAHERHDNWGEGLDELLDLSPEELQRRIADVTTDQGE